jgi:hypothetical protein
MRRRLLTAVGIMTLALAVPSVAFAHHGHHRHHHKAKAKAHHAKFRIVHIGASSATSTSATLPSGSAPTTPPTPENAGTVASYTNNVLTLTLNDNSTVSGKVTADTRIRCLKATTTPPTGTEGSDEGPGDDNGQGDDQERGDISEQGDQESDSSDESQQGDQKDGSDDDEGQGAAEPPCDTSLLVAGAVVRAAELRIGPTGTEFESIVLVR